MLHFFRKYQRYFFLVITVVIVVSFSFFGTYSALSNDGFRDQVAFTSVNGTKIRRSELDALVLFLGTDAEDKLLFGGVWGPNFLNDGVLKKDFIQTGLGELIATGYLGEMKSDLATRHEKEKRYVPYAHPQARFVSSEAAWNYLAPEIKTNFDALRSNDNFDTPDAFATRLKLFQAEKKLPAPLLKRVLTYQQQQYNWLSPDPSLDRVDLSLFGYHTIEDWFGPRFIRLCAEFIINSAQIAEKQGYKVSSAEALADLVQNAEASYKQNINNPHLGVANSVEYLNVQLNRMGLDQNKAATIWRQVVLFRRLFQDLASSLFIDPFTLGNLNEFALETVQGDLYRLPKELRLASVNDLKKFEFYLKLISNSESSAKDRLLLKEHYKTISEMAKQTPEMVQKRYFVKISQADKNLLSARVSIKDTWIWELEDNNWSLLTKQFPELGIKSANNKEERQSALDALDDKTRSRVDAYARKEIVNSHPEWLTHALDEAEPKQATISLKLKGGRTPFAGLEDSKELIKLLDNAKIGEQDPSLASFTADKNTYYKILVLDRSPELEILTFNEANKEGVLDNLLEKQPNLKIDDILAAIKEDYTQHLPSSKKADTIIDDIAATYRFNAYLRDLLSKIKKHPDRESQYLAKTKESSEEHLSVREPLEDQWKLEKIDYIANRSSEPPEMLDLFALDPNTWSRVYSLPNGDSYFVKVNYKGNESNNQALQSVVDKVQTILGQESQQVLGSQLLDVMKERKALSLDYLNQGSEMTET